MYNYTYRRIDGQFLWNIHVSVYPVHYICAPIMGHVPAILLPAGFFMLIL